MTTITAQKQQLNQNILKQLHLLTRLADCIHKNPELAFKEKQSIKLVSKYVSDHGMHVTENIAGMSTAFHAIAGDGEFNIAFCAEYDALPIIGHACGHNLIAAMSSGAATSLIPFAKQNNLTIHLFGTPGEEALDGGGKIRLFEQGYFDQLDAILMTHPAPIDVLAPKLNAGALWAYEFKADSHHAFGNCTNSATVQEAMFIADAAILVLKNHLSYGEFINGINSPIHTAPNVALQNITARYAIRAPNMYALTALGSRLTSCFESASLATGLELEVISPKYPYAEMHHNSFLLNMYEKNIRALGRNLQSINSPFGVTTDLGNASLVVPCIHPFIGLNSGQITNHQAEFANYCTGKEAERCILDGATALAWTALDASSDFKPIR